MIVRRAHLAMAWKFDQKRIEYLEENGLERLPGRAANSAVEYRLVDVLAMCRRIPDNWLTGDKIFQLIKVMTDDVKTKANKGEFSVKDAIESLEAGEHPDFPDAQTAQKTYSAYKHYTDAKIRETERKVQEGELVPKKQLVDAVNQIANMYQNRFGEAFFREFESQKEDIIAAAESDELYLYIRELMAPEHDVIVDEINKIEEGLSV